MDDFISREAAIQSTAVWNGDVGTEAWIRDALEKLPAADVRPVVRGKWIDKPSGAYGRWQSWCTACGKRSGVAGAESTRHKRFCPNCGADMRPTSMSGANGEES